MLPVQAPDEPSSFRSVLLDKISFKMDLGDF